jgi:hypothetical protein
MRTLGKNQPDSDQRRHCPNEEDRRVSGTRGK